MRFPSSLAQVARALVQSIPCGPGASSPDPAIELERRTGSVTNSPPRQRTPEITAADPSTTASSPRGSFDSEDDPETEVNVRRMRLQRHDGKVRLMFVEKDGSPEESHRPIEDYPANAYYLGKRLHPLEPAQQPTARQFVLSESHDVKVVGFNGQGKPAATTGTSKPNELCLTDGMGPCIAIAFAAEKIGADGVSRLPGAKARVMHTQPVVATRKRP